MPGCCGSATGRLEIERLVLDVNLDGDAAASLPPQLQDLLRRYRLRGTYRFTVAGDADPMDPVASELAVTANFTDAYFSYADWTYPVKKLELEAHTLGGQRLLLIDKLDLEAFGGTASVTGQLKLDEYLHALLQVKAQGLRLDMFGEDAHGTTVDQYLGMLDADVNWDGSLMYYAVDAGGFGTFDLHEARLADIPFLTELGDMLDPKKEERHGRDRIHGRFKLKRTYLDLEEWKATSGAVAAMGFGRVYLDRRLNLLFRAGALERLEEMMGRFGGIMKVPGLPTYEIRGTFDEYAISRTNRDTIVD